MDPAPTAGASERAPTVSVILATYNRGPLLARLLRQLAAQDFPAREMEVVIVDDGSTPPASDFVEPLRRELPYGLTLVRQTNAGAAAARQRAALTARGELLVILDDDMQLPSGYVSEHVRLHRQSPGRTCVMGRYAADPNIGAMPLFERYYANMWDKLTENVREGRVVVTGTILSTGNASMRREDFISVGGFDPSLKQAEDTELGLKLERSGVKMVFSESAYTLHGSDHTQLAKWLGRNYGYGVYDTRIARKHPWAAHADPWRYCFTLPKLGLPFVVTSVLFPATSRRLSGVMMKAAMAADGAGLQKLALRGAGVVFGMEYFRGVREENGSLGGALSAFREFLDKASRAPEPLAGIPSLLTRLSSLRRH